MMNSVLKSLRCAEKNIYILSYKSYESNNYHQCIPCTFYADPILNRQLVMLYNFVIHCFAFLFQMSKSIFNFGCEQNKGYDKSYIIIKGKTKTKQTKMGKDQGRLSLM